MCIPKPLPDAPVGGKAFSVCRTVEGGLRRLPRFGGGSSRGLLVLPGQASTPPRTGLLCQVRQETCRDPLPRRRDAAQGRSGESSSPLTRLLQQHVSGPQEERRDAFHHKSEVIEQRCREGEDQDGNPAGSPKGRLGHLNWPEGCLLSDPHQASLPEIPSLHSAGGSLPVQSSPIQPDLSTEGVHQSHGDSGIHSPPQGHQFLLVPRQLAPSSPIVREMSPAYKRGSPGDDWSQVHSQPGEVRPGSYPEVLLPGRGLQPGWGTGATYLGKGRENSSPVQNSQEASLSGGEISSESLRRDECSCRCHPFGQVTHASTVAVPTQPVAHVHTTFVMQCVSEQLFSGTLKLVEISGEPAITAASAFAKRDWGTLHRQFHDGWGATLHMVQGVWDQTTSDSKSINWLELMTVHLSILHFLDLLKNQSVMIRSDNLVTIYNLDKQGGTHSQDLCYLAWEILQMCHQHKTLVRVQHLNSMFWRISSADPTRRFWWNGPSVQGSSGNHKRTRQSRHRPVHHSPEPPDSGLH